MTTTQEAIAAFEHVLPRHEIEVAPEQALPEAADEVLEMVRDAYAPMSLFASTASEKGEELFFRFLFGVAALWVAYAVMH
ncbi:MAG: hypothetical protein JRJ84_08695 [Deltaproteobacteria bacterium]|nr:hypothetical protein [Deltaproteobacteria bacterium]